MTFTYEWNWVVSLSSWWRSWPQHLKDRWRWLFLTRLNHSKVRFAPYRQRRTRTHIPSGPAVSSRSVWLHQGKKLWSLVRLASSEHAFGRRIQTWSRSFIGRCRCTSRWFASLCRIVGEGPHLCCLVRQWCFQGMLAVVRKNVSAPKIFTRSLTRKISIQYLTPCLHEMMLSVQKEGFWFREKLAFGPQHLHRSVRPELVAHQNQVRWWMTSVPLFKPFVGSFSCFSCSTFCQAFLYLTTINYFRQNNN